MISTILRKSKFALACVVILTVAPLAQAGDERVWTLTIEDKPPGWAYLNYGLPETDDSFGAFRCKSRSGEAIVFIAETDAKLTAGKRATAILAVGEKRAKIAGKLLPNEDAGVPSFEGRISTSDPIFEAMAGAETLVATVGPSKQTAPLKGAAEKIRKFAAACAKP
jgi:hypothetical protein